MISRYQDITDKLSSLDVYADKDLMKNLNQELTRLEPIVKLFQKYLQLEQMIKDAKALLDDNDKEMQQIAQEEVDQHTKDILEIENKIILATVEKDPNDSRDVYMEIRAGTGGEEAAIFADCIKCIQNIQKINGKLKL